MLQIPRSVRKTGKHLLNKYNTPTNRRRVAKYVWDNMSGTFKQKYVYPVAAAVGIMQGLRNRTRTRTGTRPGRPRKTPIIMPYIPPAVHGGMTNSFYRVPRKRPPRYVRMAIKNNTIQSYTATGSALMFSADPYSQNIFTGYQVQKCPLDAFADTTFRFNLFNTIMTGTAGNSIEEQYYSARVFFKNFWRTDLITNFDYSTCVVDIYVWRPRIRALDRPDELWFAGGQASAAFTGQTDYDNDSNFGTQNNATKVPNTKPFLSRFVTENYKCIYSRRVELSGGSTHKFTLSMPINRMVTGKELTQLGVSRLPAFETHVHYVINGTPIWYPAVPSPTVTPNYSNRTVTSSKINVGLTCNFGGAGCKTGTEYRQNIAKNNYSVATNAEYVPTDLNNNTD